MSDLNSRKVISFNLLLTTDKRNGMLNNYLIEYTFNKQEIPLKI